MYSKKKKFSSEWWDDFLLATSNMADVAVFRGCLSEDETRQMRAEVIQILSDIGRMRTTRHGFRAWVDNQMVPKSDMGSIYDLCPREDEDLEVWVRRAFGGRKFGMILNQGERFNLSLSDKIALLIHPLLLKVGIPTEGIIFTLFIGNYDSTPLGIHMDRRGKSVVHFHLGPGDKTMYTWDTDKYLQAIGDEPAMNNPNIDKHISYARAETFGAGDLYFMPENIFHVGQQNGLSIGLACWFYNRASDEFAERLLGIISEDYLRSSDQMLKPDLTPLSETNYLNDTLQLFEIPEWCSQMTFKDFLLATYQDLRFKLRSNAGYRTNPFPIDDLVELEMDDIVVKDEPYRIILRPITGTNLAWIYVRGSKFEVTHFPCIASLIDDLNEGAPRRVEDLLVLLDPAWPKEVGLYLLSMLMRLHGIRQVRSAS